MKRRLIPILMAAILLFSACSPGKTGAPDNEPAVFIPEDIPGELVYIPFPVDIQVDGALTDWEQLPSYRVDTGSSTSADPEENGSFSFSVAADAENFYITMKMPDKNIIAGKHGTEFWNEDSMEFFINASGDLNAAKYVTNIFQININAADIGNTDPQALTITGVFSSGIPVKGFVFKTGDGWGFEASLPLEGILDVTHGREIGFQAQINGASQQDRNVKLIWSKMDTSDQSWQVPAVFGRAIFFELGRDDIPQPSLVQALPTAIPTAAPVVIPSMVSVNQSGYPTDGIKIASVAIEAKEPQEWTLLDGEGKVVMAGKTLLFGEDKASGDFLQIIDFTSFKTIGSGYRISSNGLESVPFDIRDDIYTQLKKEAAAYFYHNRSGTPIEAEFVGEAWARPAGHLTDDNVTCFKGKDADGNDWPGCDYTLDVSGGWYDAGDFGKYVVNGGISAWTLMDLYEQMPDAFPDGSLAIPESSNDIPDILDEARWEMEFLLSMQVPEGEDLAGMAHHKIHDESWAGMPMIPPGEVDNDNAHAIAGTGRYLFPPSTAATLNLAATGAVCARVWKNIDPIFAKECLSAAENAWDAANANPGLYAGNTPGQGGGNYDDRSVSDEFYWAAAELFITTGQEMYKTYLLNSDQFGMVDSFDWGITSPLGTISLALHENALPADKKALLLQNIVKYADEMLAAQSKDGYGVLINGNYPWGSNGLILNNMILVSLAHRLSRESRYLGAVQLSMDYILGRNPVNQSYVSGFGEYAMQHPHHRFWANDPANGYPSPPAGALSGGPNANPDDPVANNAGLQSLPESKRYIDDIGSYTTNEVTINWNAPLVWISAYLDENK